MGDADDPCENLESEDYEDEWPLSDPRFHSSTRKQQHSDQSDFESDDDSVTGGFVTKSKNDNSKTLQET